MQLESTAVNTGEEISTQPRNQNRQRPDRSSEEHNEENSAVMQADFKQTAIPVTKSLEAPLEALLNSHHRIPAGRGARLIFFSSQQIFGHGRNNGSRKKIRSQTGEHYGLGGAAD